MERIKEYGRKRLGEMEGEREEMGRQIEGLEAQIEEMERS